MEGLKPSFAHFEGFPDSGLPAPLLPELSGAVTPSQGSKAKGNEAKIPIFSNPDTLTKHHFLEGIQPKPSLHLPNYKKPPILKPQNLFALFPLGQKNFEISRR